MRITLSIASLACTLGLGVTAMSAQAAPMSHSALLGASMSNVESTAAHCSWRNGEKYCAYGHGPRYRTHGFPEDYRTGSRNWWEEMDRDQRGGRR
jgi:hypothetical protein